MNRLFPKLCVIALFALLKFTNASAQHWMTNREIYDFNVGDILESVGVGPGAGETSRDSIMSKSYSANHDTLFYKIYVIRIANSQGILDTVTYYDMLKYTNLDSLVMKGAHSDHRSRNDTTGLETYIDSMWIDSQTNRVVNESFWQDNNHFEPMSRTDRYAAGLGEIFKGYYGGGYQYLIYYRKGYEKWGRSFVEGINEKKYNVQQITIYPVPAVSGQAITLRNVPKGNVQLTIMDMSGRVMITKQYYSEGVINCTLEGAYKSGVYVLRMVSGNQVFTSKLMIENAY
jgi:hypothetical protein